MSRLVELRLGCECDKRPLTSTSFLLIETKSGSAKRMCFKVTAQSLFPKLRRKEERERQRNVME